MAKAAYSQATRQMEVLTPLGPQALLLSGFLGREAISQLFHFDLDLLAENHRDIPFDKLLGQKITVRLALTGGKNRYFNGLVSRLTQGMRDDLFTHYRAEMVPEFWLLTRRGQCRIFQHLSVPEILKKVLQGLNVAYQIQGTFHPRDYCVQYRETDFHFVSRLLEEEGIYYFFKHAADGHQLVLANTPASHPDLPETTRVPFDPEQGGQRDPGRITEWEKVQELRSGKYTLWDHCFELPHKHLEAEKAAQESVAVGGVTHKLRLPGHDQLEIFDYPGGYAHRGSGIDRGGGERPAHLEKIFEDNQRAVEIRMQREALAGLVARGAGHCRQFVSGHQFTLEGHWSANGPYVLTGVEHAAKVAGDFRSGQELSLGYSNRFTCIPLGLPFRPPPVTPRPRVEGTQTAVVVGPAGPDQIFTDKYGRVKVQFHWDRQGKYDADSSCWVRVSTYWAGKQWGAIHLPRIGHEVIVDFLEGDPDRPIIIGCVYNAEMMPPVPLPEKRKVSGLVTQSNHPGPAPRFNLVTYDDANGAEIIQTKAQHNLIVAVGTDHKVTIQGGEDTYVGKDQKYFVGGSRDGDVQGNDQRTVGALFRIQADKIWLNAKTEVVIDCGDDRLTIRPGNIVLTSKMIDLNP
jgi:type VI secretion system secreted protein VgrG